MKEINQLEHKIGMYVSRAGYSDVDIIGKIVGVKGKRTFLVKPMRAEKQLTKLEFLVGGFAGHCINQQNQEWSFKEYDEIIEVKNLKNSRLVFSEKPYHYYDYNF